MTTFAIIGGGVAIIGLLIWLYGRQARKAGATASVAEGQKKVLDNVKKAKKATARLDNDPAYRKRVRKRHTRK